MRLGRWERVHSLTPAELEARIPAVVYQARHRGPMHRYDTSRFPRYAGKHRKGEW